MTNAMQSAPNKYRMEIELLEKNVGVMLEELTKAMRELRAANVINNALHTFYLSQTPQTVSV